MPSIRDLRDHRQRESFTGREAELELFRRLLEASPPEHALLHLYGVGGVGKSSLLRQLRRLCAERGCPSALVDMQVNFGVVDVLRGLRDQLTGPRQEFAEFDKALELYNDVKSKLQEAVGSLAHGVISGLREGVPLGLGALAVDAIGEEQVKSWLYRHLPRANAELYLRGDSILTERLVAGVNAIAERLSREDASEARGGRGVGGAGGAQGGLRVVLFLDTYEQASQAQDDWLRDTLLESELSDRVLLVLAGRDPLQGRWHEWRSVLLEREVQPFSEEEARAYLARRGVSDPAQIESTLHLTGRLPWALALLTDTPATDELAGAPNAHLLGDKLVERFLSQVEEDPELRELTQVCAVLRTFDHDVVRAVWGRHEPEEAMRRLRRYSFLQARPDGRWSVSQVVRGFLDSALRRRTPEQWLELNRRAHELYSARAARAPRYSPEWTWLTLEDLYHRLRLDEEQGIAHLGRLFEEAKRVYRRDFCSELLSNVLDVPLALPSSERWLAFYRGVMASLTSSFGWDRVRAADEELYAQRDLPPALRARVTTDLGRYCYQVAGEPERGLALLEESLALRRELRDEDGEAHVLSHLAAACAGVGALERGRACAEECVRLAGRLGQPYRLGWGHFSLGLVEAARGQREAALAALQQALSTFEGASHEFEAGVVHYHLARVLHDGGDQAAALSHLETHLRVMLRYEKTPLAARALVDICELLLRREDRGALTARLAQAERLVLGQHNRPQLARLRLLQAELALREASPDGDEPPAPPLGAPPLRPPPPGQVALHRGASGGRAEGGLASAASLLRDALFTACQVPRIALGPTGSGIERLFAALEAAGREPLADQLRATLLRAAEAALAGADAPLPEPARAPLAELASTWRARSS